MKIPQLTNLRKTLIKSIGRHNTEINFIKNVIRQIDIIQDTNENKCPNCFSRDLRYMKNKRIFCRACGYESEKVNKVETNKN